MKSKIQAAKTALSLGVKVFIGRGKGRQKLLEILDGHGDGTYIGGDSLTTVNNPKQWIALHSQVSGKLYVDQGAELALTSRGSSLLPAGIYEIIGSFEKGDVVEVFGENGLIGKGEVYYSAQELRKVMGKRKEDVEKEMIVASIEVIHRDKWVKAKK